MAGGPGPRPHQAGLRWDLLCRGTLGGLGKPDGPSQNNVFNANKTHWFTEQTCYVEIRLAKFLKDKFAM